MAVTPRSGQWLLVEIWKVWSDEGLGKKFEAQHKFWLIHINCYGAWPPAALPIINQAVFSNLMWKLNSKAKLGASDMCNDI